MSPAARVARVREGDRQAIARALSEVEADQGGLLARALYPYTGRAHVAGITGAPGVGKSTLASALAGAWRAAGRTVGMVAIDPSSPYTGGAILGDRVRMAAHHGDAGVFIRSMAARGQPGGLAQAAADAVRVLDAAGFDMVLLETAGAGQAEVRVADECHTTVVVVIAAGGDDVQAQKAGILETANVLVVNKADEPGAEAAVGYLRAMLALGEPREPGWDPPVLAASALAKQGIGEVAAAVDAHAVHLRRGDGWRAREARRAEAELERALYRRLVAPRLAQASLGGAERSILADLVARTTDPTAAADRLLAEREATPAIREAERR